MKVKHNYGEVTRVNTWQEGENMVIDMELVNGYVVECTIADYAKIIASMNSDGTIDASVIGAYTQVK